MSAGLAALRAAASKERGAGALDDIRERLAQTVERDQDRGGPRKVAVSATAYKLQT